MPGIVKASSGAPQVDAAIELALYRSMLEMREFEVKVQELYRAGKLPGFVHLYVGEEAVAGLAIFVATPILKCGHEIMKALQMPAEHLSYGCDPKTHEMRN